MLHQKIEKLIPYFSENFITYPLWEEGLYIPFVNFWQKCESDQELKQLHERLDDVFERSGYDFFMEYDDESVFSNKIRNFSIHPEFNQLDYGVYQFVKKDWSIEEMLDLLLSALNK